MPVKTEVGGRPARSGIKRQAAAFCAILAAVSEPPPNVTPDEVAKFERLAQEWWDPNGKLRTLHDLNPARLAWLESRVPLAGKHILDLGCGGGILTEALAHRGARVLGLDASETAIAAASRHARANGLEIQYGVGKAEDFAPNNENRFDVVTCMELVEHVPDPQALLRDCARLLRPGGHLALATLNRNLKAYLAAIIGAEYLLGLLPKGTHSYAQFARPSELDRWLRQAGFKTLDVRGMRYLPLLRHCALTDDPSVNYLLHARLDWAH